MQSPDIVGDRAPPELEGVSLLAEVGSTPPPQGLCTVLRLEHPCSAPVTPSEVRSLSAGVRPPLPPMPAQGAATAGMGAGPQFPPAELSDGCGQTQVGGAVSPTAERGFFSVG